MTGRIDEALKENARVQKERELYIRADKDARYGVVALVVAAARNSGVESLNLLVEPEIEDVPEDPGASRPKPKPGKPGRVPAPGALKRSSNDFAEPGGDSQVRRLVLRLRHD